MILWRTCLHRIPKVSKLKISVQKVNIIRPMDQANKTGHNYVESHLYWNGKQIKQVTITLKVICTEMAGRAGPGHSLVCASSTYGKVNIMTKSSPWCQGNGWKASFRFRSLDWFYIPFLLWCNWLLVSFSSILFPSCRQTSLPSSKHHWQTVSILELFLKVDFCLKSSMVISSFKQISLAIYVVIINQHL